ncbi:putative signal transducing protein [Mucilaginibacter ginsenosidivorans]|nr:DUF2007 domain-containing protein [Mucilaginibacter ginsenosidivorans]
MDTFVTVLTVQYPQQLWIIRGKLESEGIECFIKDELTVQAYNLYSNAVGGVKLQVQRQDVAKAVEILTELGYIRDEPIKPNLLTIIEKKKASISFLKKINVVRGIVIVVLLFITLLTTALYFILRPSLSDLLIQNSWCVDRIDYMGKPIGPKTVITGTGIYISMTNINGEADCLEKMALDNSVNHIITLPGINSNSIFGTWESIDNESIVISTHTLKNIFAGRYEGNISGEQLTLKSKTTIIYAHRDNYRIIYPF